MLCIAYSTNIYACIGGKGFLPENDLYIGVNQTFGISGVTDSEFNNILDKVQEVYGQEIKSYGGTLQIKRKWDDGTVNAMAYREGSHFIIEMFGGLARHQSITKDAFALVACHEIGHHIGGAPHYSQAGNTWASTEGQSDYFATMKCLRKLFSIDNNEQIISEMKIDPLVESQCNDKHTVSNDQAICKRISMAGLASASMFAVMQNQSLPRFENPDPSTVTSSYESHPQYQCRLDTYFNGAICEISEDEEIGQNDPNEGTCNRLDQYDHGIRPLCWYKPAGGTTGPDPDPDPEPTPAGVAKTPHINGQTSINSNNPSMMIPIQIDVSNIQGAAGFAFEVSKPNAQFSNPNGSAPDQQNGLFLEVYQGTGGVYNLLPSQRLPNWGIYQIRIIALDNNKKPVSKNSNSFILNLRR